MANNLWEITKHVGAFLIVGALIIGAVVAWQHLIGYHP